MSKCEHNRQSDCCVQCLRAEVSRLRSESAARARVLTDDEREELFLEHCLEHARTGAPRGEDGDPFFWFEWYKEDVARLVQIVRKYKGAMPKV
jgi:hypothetical protein